MDIQNVAPTDYADIFSLNKDNQGPRAHFGAENEVNLDLFTQTTTQNVVTETTTIDEVTPPGEIDLLNAEGKIIPIVEEDAFTDTAKYFESRIKSGKFVPIEEEDAEGNKVTFVPKTAEEFDEVIELQLNYQLEQKQAEIEEKWLSTKTPAWKAVAKYADLVNNPSELIQFIQGVETIQTVAQIDEDTNDGAEAIVRTRLARRGEGEEMINEQIEMLKTTDKLIGTAQKYKPILVQEEQVQLGQLMEEKERERSHYLNTISQIRDNTIKTLNAPFFGSQSLTQEEKATVYDLIGAPSQESKGFPIYDKIDQLFGEGNYEMLAKLALFISKPERFVTYVTAQELDKSAGVIQKKLRVAGELKGTTYVEPQEPVKQTIKRQQYNTTPRFGR